jgi:hypothetical protein
LKGKSLIFLPVISVLVPESGEQTNSEQFLFENNSKIVTNTGFRVGLILISIIFILTIIYFYLTKNCAKSYSDIFDSDSKTKQNVCLVCQISSGDWIELCSGDEIFSNLVSIISFDGAIGVVDLSKNSLSLDSNCTLLQRPKRNRKNRLREKAMAYHSLTYRQGQISFDKHRDTRRQSQPQTAAEPTQTDIITKNIHEETIQIKQAKAWSLKMKEKCIFIGRADGIIEEYKFANSAKIILKNSKKISQNGITHIELIQNYIICITLGNLYYIIYRLD